nr:immunoglobulin light chain junction region [Macaca mulatta]
RMQVLQTPFTF